MLAVPADQDRCLSGGFGGVLGGADGVVEVHRPVGEEAFAAGDDGVAVDDAGDAEPLAVGEALDGGEFESGVAGAGGDRPGDGVLRRVLERCRRSAAARRDRRRRRCDVDEGHRAGGDGAGLVEHDGVDPPGGLQHLGALDDHAELGAAAGADEDRGRGGQAEGARAGDDQHGDGGGERHRRGLADPQPEPEGGDGEGDDDRHEHRRDPVGESLHRRLPLWASCTSRAIWASSVSAPTRVARTTSRPPALRSPR